MDGQDYLNHFRDKGESFSPKTEKTLIAIFNRLINKGVDPLEFFDSLRLLVQELRETSFEEGMKVS